MRVLVTRTGVIGAGIIPELLRRGHSVRLLAPDAAEFTRQWPRVEPFAGDPQDSKAFRSAAGGCDVVLVFDGVAPADTRSASLVIKSDVVYGPGDDVLSAILKAVRTLPAIPALANGDRPFRPIWYGDFGRAVVDAVEAGSRELAIAGSETTTLDDLIERFQDITQRKPLRLPIALSFRVDVPEPPAAPRIIEDAISLDEGLRLLADSIPELLPDEGVGKMHHKRFWADIAGARLAAVPLMSYFRENINDVMPIDASAEPGTPTRVASGLTLTLHLPMRGNVQVRVERAEATDVVLATLEGHPIAGVVEFKTADLPGGYVRFSIDVFSRSANILDLIALRLLGDRFQSANWRTVVERMIEASGGTSDGVQHSARTLDEDDASMIEQNIHKLVEKRQRAETGLTG